MRMRGSSSRVAASSLWLLMSVDPCCVIMLPFVSESRMLCNREIGVAVDNIHHETYMLKSTHKSSVTL